MFNVSFEGRELRARENPARVLVHVSRGVATLGAETFLYKSIHTNTRVFMPFRSPAAALLGSPARAAVLAALLQAPPAELLSSRAVARLARVSPRGALLILSQLDDAGLVSRARVGRTDAWTLNASHAALPALRALLAPSPAALEKEIRSALTGLPVRRAVLFGSVTRGEEAPGSDVDVLFVVPREEDKERVLAAVAALNHSLLQRYGAAVSPLIYTLAEFKKKRKTPLVQRLEREGRILMGERHAR